MLPPTPLDKNEVVIFLLGNALSYLENAETAMQGGVSADAWPQVGRLLSDISHTMKQIELTVSGIGGH